MPWPAITLTGADPAAPTPACDGGSVGPGITGSGQVAARTSRRPWRSPAGSCRDSRPRRTPDARRGRGRRPPRPRSRAGRIRLRKRARYSDHARADALDRAEQRLVVTAPRSRGCRRWGPAPCGPCRGSTTAAAAAGVSASSSAIMPAEQPHLDVGVRHADALADRCAGRRRRWCGSAPGRRARRRRRPGCPGACTPCCAPGRTPTPRCGRSAPPPASRWRGRRRVVESGHRGGAGEREVPRVALEGQRHVLQPGAGPGLIDQRVAVGGGAAPRRRCRARRSAANRAASPPAGRRR